MTETPEHGPDVSLFHGMSADQQADVCAIYFAGHRKRTAELEDLRDQVGALTDERDALKAQNRKLRTLVPLAYLEGIEDVFCNDASIDDADENYRWSECRQALAAIG